MTETLNNAIDYMEDIMFKNWPSGSKQYKSEGRNYQQEWKAKMAAMTDGPVAEAEMFPAEHQSGLSFPMPLTEKYRPQSVDGFIGISDAKKVFAALLKAPRPCALLLTGAPGVGKTTLAMAFAKELHAGLIHHASAKITVEAIGETRDRLNYQPKEGGWWVVLCDEADRMHPQAQAALLSALDSANTLRLKFGGGFEQGAPLKVIWIFTCNGTGEQQTNPPANLEPRFLSRCLKVKFPPVNGEMPAYLQGIWQRETNGQGLDFAQVAHDANGSVRDALQTLELSILTA